MTTGKLKELERLIRQYQDRLFSLAFYRTGSVHDAKDIVQDVFVKMYDSDAMQRSADLKSYLFRCVLNKCTDHLRSRRGRRTVELPADDTLRDEPSEPFQAEYIRIEKLISSVPSEQADVITMKCVGNLSFVEIAEILDIPVSTAKSRFRYGVDKLREKFN